MTTLADQQQRADALDAARSFIVQAPAGSGKTELLVRRYLSLLACVDAPEQILAITFTKKATAEMRRRIVCALKLIKPNGDAEDNAELLALAQAARENDARHNWRITEDARRLRIQTIDSFCAELVRRMPWSARFGAPPEIIDDPAPLHQRAAKRALDHIDADDEWSDACARLLALVDADWSRAQALLANMLDKRDKWLRRLGPAQRKDIEQMWCEVIDIKLKHADGLIDATEKTHWIALGRFAAENLRAEGIENAVTALHNAADFPQPSHHNIEAWRAIAALVLTQQGEYRKRVDKRNGFPAHDKTMKAEMQALLAQLQPRGDLLAALQTVTQLPSGAFSDAQWDSLDALMRVLRLAAGELRTLFAEQNQADFIELTQRAGMALGDTDAPSDLGLALDYQLTHILMDEFQDTSAAHIELLKRLTAGWQRDDGRTLFLVGDPMQSIYAFREAEVANFLQAQQHGIGDLELTPLVLQTNFRSTPSLVAWFNQTFAQVLPAHDDLVNGAVRYASATAHARDDEHAGEARFHIGVERDANDEARAIAELIARAQQQDAQQSIAVLGRTRAHLHRIAEALRADGVAFQAIDMEPLAERPAIRDLTALTRALAHDFDRIAWLSLLRAPWCALALDELHAIAADRERTIAEVCADKNVTAALSDDGRTRLARFVDAIFAARARRGRIDLRRNVEAAWLALGGPAGIDATDLDDCQRYLDLLGELEAKRIEITAENLSKASEKLWARAAVNPQVRVQLLSIHKAKGLEFDTVILPSLQRATRGDERALLRWQALPEQLLFAPLPSSVDTDDRFYQYLASLSKEQAQHELGRLLYVACTRARKSLHLFADVQRDGDGDCARTPRADSFLHLLWSLDEVRRECDAAVTAVDDNAVDDDADDTNQPPAPRMLQRLPLTWRLPALPPTVAAPADAGGGDEDDIEFDWAGENARVIGIVLHWIFQRIDDIGWERWCAQAIDAQQESLWRAKLAEGGIADGDMDDALARLRDAITSARDDQRAAWIFSPQHQQIKTEWSLAGIVDGRVAHVIIDRSFVDVDGVRWIIDFKSSRHLGGDADAFLDEEMARYREQMTRYAAVVGALDSPDISAIRLGLYFPALRGWREWTAHG